MKIALSWASGYANFLISQFFVHNLLQIPMTIAGPRFGKLFIFCLDNPISTENQRKISSEGQRDKFCHRLWREKEYILKPSSDQFPKALQVIYSSFLLNCDRHGACFGTGKNWFQSCKVTSLPPKQPYPSLWW